MTEQNDKNLSERRDYARLRKEFVARVTELPESAITPVQPIPESVSEEKLASDEMTGKNISLWGIAVETPTDYPVGSILAVEVLLPELEKNLAPLQRDESSRESGLFRATCRVMWSTLLPEGKFTVGLHFVNLDERQFRALSRLVAKEPRA